MYLITILFSNISYNYLTGEIPNDIGKLKYLEILSIFYILFIIT